MEILEYHFPKVVLSNYLQPTVFQLKAYYIQLTVSFSVFQKNMPTSPKVFQKQQAVYNKNQCPFKLSPVKRPVNSQNHSRSMTL